MQDRERILENAAQMDKLRERGQLCDVMLICDGTEIPAHRIVLSSCCLYFQAKFSNTVESKVEMRGVQVKPLLCALRYIYSGRYPSELENDVTSLKAILVLSDFLQLFRLAEFCRESLVKNMSLDNCLDLLDVSGTCIQGDEMQKYAGQNFDKLYYTSQFRYLSVNQLSLLLNCARDSQRSDILLKALLQWVKYNTDARLPDLPKLLNMVDVDKLSLEFLQILIGDFLVQSSGDLAHLLFKSAVNRLCDQDYLVKSLEKPLDGYDWSHFQIDFVNQDLRGYVHTCNIFTYFFDDNLWSDLKPCLKVTANKIATLCCSGNYVYYFEKVNKNLITFRKFHFVVENFQEIDYPYERYDLYSVIDMNGNIYLHVSTKLICYSPNGDWNCVCTGLPAAPSVLLTCLDYLYCINDAPNLIRFHPPSKMKSTFMIPKEFKIKCTLKISACSEHIYFLDDKAAGFMIYDCKRNEWKGSPLPTAIKQLGEKWEFCSVKKEITCLIFVDDFKLVWKYYPNTDGWKRVSNDPKYVQHLTEVFVRC